MKFNEHYNLSGKHATFSPSQPQWLRYSNDKLVEVFENKQAVQRGTELHAWAEQTINLRIKQARSKKTLCAYVNDAIGFGMETERVLYYSDHFYGTADAICFDEKSQFLRIHDLKTGKHPAKIEQLLVYAALFCLEYRMDPFAIGMELRIYQNDEIITFIPTAQEVKDTMKNIIDKNNYLEKYSKGV